VENGKKSIPSNKINSIDVVCEMKRSEKKSPKVEF